MNGGSAVQRVFERLARLELGGLRRVDLDRLARLRIAARARFSIRDLEGAEPRDVALVAAPKRRDDVVEDRVHDPFSRALLEVDLRRNGLDQLGLGHADSFLGRKLGRAYQPIRRQSIRCVTRTDSSEYRAANESEPRCRAPTQLSG